MTTTTANIAPSTTAHIHDCIGLKVEEAAMMTNWMAQTFVFYIRMCNMVTKFEVTRFSRPGGTTILPFEIGECPEDVVDYIGQINLHDRREGVLNKQDILRITPRTIDIQVNTPGCLSVLQQVAIFYKTGPF